MYTIPVNCGGLGTLGLVGEWGPAFFFLLHTELTKTEQALDFEPENYDADDPSSGVSATGPAATPVFFHASFLPLFWVPCAAVIFFYRSLDSLGSMFS